jgi:hypothetical protein
MASTTSSTLERGLLSSSDSVASSFTRRSATYTASTFAAFEYGSSYQYHGMFNVKGDDDPGAKQTDEDKYSDKRQKVPSLDDLDELLLALTDQELNELSVIDPDVSLFS